VGILEVWLLLPIASRGGGGRTANGLKVSVWFGELWIEMDGRNWSVVYSYYRTPWCGLLTRERMDWGGGVHRVEIAL